MAYFLIGLGMTIVCGASFAAGYRLGKIREKESDNNLRGALVKFFHELEEGPNA